MSLQRFHFPTAITMGAGARAELPAALEELGRARPLIVIDRGLRSIPIFEGIIAGLPRAARFDDFPSIPRPEHVAAAARVYREGGCDAIVSIGGGVAMDLAKAAAVSVHHPGAIFDYEDGADGARPIDGILPDIIALPTTAGTGSEVGRSTVISDEAGVKRIIFSPRLMARRVLADPELLVGLPPSITAATGLDALTHCVEAFLVPGFHPLCDGLAMEGVRLVARSLVASAEDGADLAARQDMMGAAMLGGVAFQKGLGANHSLAHALGQVSELHHGLANGIALPHLLRFNASSCADKLELLGRLVGAERPGPEPFIAWVAGLVDALPMPKTLGEAGVARADLDALVKAAAADPCQATNPRPVSADDFRALFEAAF